MKFSNLFLAIAFPVALLGLFMATLQTKASPSATFTVNSTVDAVDANPGNGVCQTAVPGQCTLRAAVMEANALPGNDSINLPTGIFTLTLPGDDFESEVGDINITDGLTLSGASTSSTIIDGGAIDGVIDVRTAPGKEVSLSNLTIQNGVSGSFGAGVCNCSQATSLILHNVVVRNNANLTSGGGIWNGGQITMTNSSVYNNITANAGGGILNSANATMIIENSKIFSNTANFEGIGGGIYNTGQLTVSYSSVYQNSVIADGYVGGVGGGIANYEEFPFEPGTVLVSNSSITNNLASAAGGGYYNISGNSSLVNVTISENALPGSGSGGGVLQLTGTTVITNATIVNNSATLGSGIRASGGSILIANTIVSSNSPGNNCAGSIVSNGFNLENGNSCNFVTVGDIINIDPMLGPLQDNGGQTPTYALLTGSPAIDSGSNTFCPPTDQRGFTRPEDGNGDNTAVCDIGAFEFGATEPEATISINNSGITEGNSGTKEITFQISLARSSSLPVTVTYSTANNTAISVSDYVATSGNLVFIVGETVKTVSVVINGDTIPEADETFFLNLSDAQNALLIDNQGLATIINDDYHLYLPMITK